jgi:hypothetical protein
MRLLKSLVAGASLLLMSFQAHAALMSPSVVAEDNAGLYTITFPGNQIVFDWTQSPGAAFVEFTTAVDFILSLDSYSSSSNSSSRMQLRDSAGNSLIPAVIPAGIAQATPAQLNPLAAADGDVPGGNGEGLQINRQDSGVLFSFLTAGTYYLGLQENGQPDDATVTFSVTAVPVPAAGLLFGSALFGAAALRRRKAL